MQPAVHRVPIIIATITAGTCQVTVYEHIDRKMQNWPAVPGDSKRIAEK